MSSQGDEHEHIPDKTKCQGIAATGSQCGNKEFLIFFSRVISTFGIGCMCGTQRRSHVTRLQDFFQLLCVRAADRQVSNHCKSDANLYIFYIAIR